MLPLPKTYCDQEAHTDVVTTARPPVKDYKLAALLELVPPLTTNIRASVRIITVYGKLPVSFPRSRALPGFSPSRDCVTFDWGWPRT